MEFPGFSCSAQIIRSDAGPCLNARFELARIGFDPVIKGLVKPPSYPLPERSGELRSPSNEPPTLWQPVKDMWIKTPLSSPSNSRLPERLPDPDRSYEEFALRGGA